MTAWHALHIREEPLNAVRVACGVIAAIVVVDALSIGAPNLSLLAVPFVIAAFRFSHATDWGSALVVAACALYVAVGVAYAVGSGVDAPWGDLLFAYAGTPLAAAAGVLTLQQVMRHHRH